MCSSLFCYYIKQIDSMLPCVCSVKDHRSRQNVIRTSVTVTRLSPCVPLFCSYHILASSVIYYCTDARQHGIYLLIINQLVPQPHPVLTRWNPQLQTSCSSCCDVSKWTVTESTDSLTGDTGVLFIIAENSPFSSSNSNGGFSKEIRKTAKSFRHWQRR